MEKHHMRSVLKSALFLILATFALNAFATNGIYLGNPSRPDTVWVPDHCVNGCWVDGYYLKVLSPLYCNDVVWVGDHYQLRHYRVVNPGRDSDYAGFAI